MDQGKDEYLMAKVLIHENAAWYPTIFGWISRPVEEVWACDKEIEMWPGYKLKPKSVLIGYLVTSPDGGNLNKGYWKLFNKDNCILNK